MSAVCFLFARNIQKLLTEEGISPAPIGLISSEWGGTPIQSWSPQYVSDQCDYHFVKEQQREQREQSLWNAMINPLKKTSLKGFLWYQGENNNVRSWFNTESYQCAFPAMIASWRKEFSEHSSTSLDAPFGFVQLGTK